MHRSFIVNVCVQIHVHVISVNIPLLFLEYTYHNISNIPVPSIWNAKLTETQIFRVLSIEELSILIIELSNLNRQLSNSIKELSNTRYPIRELFNWIIELCN